jgi:hypothetical protein
LLLKGLGNALRISHGAIHYLMADERQGWRIEYRCGLISVDVAEGIIKFAFLLTLCKQSSPYFSRRNTFTWRMRDKAFGRHGALNTTAVETYAGKPCRGLIMNIRDEMSTT